MTNEIHVFWDGQFTLVPKNLPNNPECDRGLYQVSGHHPVYGQDKLLYLGLTIGDQQSFSSRIPEEGWLKSTITPDTKAIRAQVGRLMFPDSNWEKMPKLELDYISSLTGEIRNEKYESWKYRVELAERLLIYSHKPGYNKDDVKHGESGPELFMKEDTHVFNWGAYKNVLPEVSSARWCKPRPDQVVDSHRIDINWKSYSAMKDATVDEPCLYQIYGNHFLYGSQALLGLGYSNGESSLSEKMEEFLSERSCQPDTSLNGYESFTVRVGSPVYKSNICLEEVLKFLIYTSKPSFNKEYCTLGGNTELLKNIHILNWGNYGILLPEITSARWYWWKMKCNELNYNKMQKLYVPEC